MRDFDLTVATNIINSALSFKCDSHFTTFPIHDPYDYEFNTSSPLINAIFHPDTGEIMTYRKLIKDENTRDIWLRLFANKLGRLTQGVGNRIPDGTDTMRYIKYSDMPKNRFAT